MRLIAKKRSTHKAGVLFHIFDTMFSTKLDYVFADKHEKYDFLQFSDFFDKQHYKSPKNVTANSIMLFVINNEDRDYAVVAVDVSTQKFILYDCQHRAKETFLLHVKKIKQFLGDYFECFPPLENLASEASRDDYEQDFAKALKFQEVNDWKLE